MFSELNSDKRDILIRRLAKDLDLTKRIVYYTIVVAHYY